MQKHLFKELLTFVSGELLKKFPEAIVCPTKDQPKAQAKLFSIAKLNGCNAYLLIQGRDLDESFTAEVGVSRRGGFPWKSDVNFDEGTGDPIPSCPSRCRLGFITPPYKDMWYPATCVTDPDLDASEEEMMRYLLLDETAENFPGDLIESNARKVVNGLHKYALPFLRKCANTAGK